MKHLSWFLGPKGENADIFRNSVMSILQEYVSWRRHYYPGDSSLMDGKTRREHAELFDRIEAGVMEMMTELRRSIPFHSPRYIGHMVSDITMPSMLGYLAGMLYNPNNVTPEAAPVTVEWEIEACNRILAMLGFTPSPQPPQKDAAAAEWEQYARKLHGEYGWARITSGGTVGNIEALWVARIVKYYPLAIQDVALQEGLDISVQLPDQQTQDIKQIEKRELLFVKPGESVYLFSRFIRALSRKRQISVEEANALSAELLQASPYSLSSHVGKVFCEFEPVIFCSGAAHYSVKKAADILGIGRANVVLVKTDAKFRLDVHDLEMKLLAATEAGKVPLAVLAVAGTTEEGAVDPVHEIVALREKLEKKNISFWLHIDAAWGGYISSLFKLEEEEEQSILLKKMAAALSANIPDGLHLPAKCRLLTDAIAALANPAGDKRAAENTEEAGGATEAFRMELRQLQEGLEKEVIDGKAFLNALREVLLKYGDAVCCADGAKLKDILPAADISVTDAERADLTAAYVQDTVSFSLNGQKNATTLKWGEQSVISSFLAFRHADSITIDPHKLGFVQYPCGVIAFRNDRVRHFIMQKAPYITTSEEEVLLHYPPRHVTHIGPEKAEPGKAPATDYHIETEAFALFMLEGSKPGAAAASLWFATQAIPLNRSNHGAIIKDTLLSARELYEWLTNWEKIYTDSKQPEELLYDFLTFGTEPDTNLLVFAVKRKQDDTLEAVNELTAEVYKRFSVQVEMGLQEHSYSLPFFITKTIMFEEQYPFAAFQPFFERSGIRDAAGAYGKHGFLVLRTTVMNPYIASIRRHSKRNLLREFVRELHTCANALASEEE